MIPRTFCITLKETPQRTKGFLESAKSANINAELFYGVLGVRLGLSAKNPNTLECPKGDVYVTEGSIGCTLSHYMLWKTLQHQPESEFLILEDDVELYDGFQQKFENLYYRLPKDWDMVYVGWFPHGYDKNPVIVDEGISIRLPSATHAYLIKKAILEKLCECMIPIQSKIDLTLVEKFLPKIKYYVFDPSIVSQKSLLNHKDSIWNSIVYDWKLDLYGTRKKMLRELSLLDGWYSIEKDKDNYWIWSKDNFSINIPPKIDNITLKLSTPIQNVLSLTCNNVQKDIPLNVGDNEIALGTGNANKLEGKLNTPFIPSQMDNNSSDSRTLGICLKKIEVNISGENIPIEVYEL